MLITLTEKCGADIDQSIRSHSYFDPVTYLKQLAPLNQVIALFVGRCHTMWKQPEILDWLLENAKYVVDNFKEFKKKAAAAENTYVEKKLDIFVIVVYFFLSFLFISFEFLCPPR